MSPVSKTSIILGLPSISKLPEEPISDGNSERELVEKNSHDAADCIVFFINDTILGQSPQIEIMVTDKLMINAILDSRSEVNLISQEIYEKLIKAGATILVLPVENVVLVTAFGKRSK
jgi:hypothetical protein